MPDDNQPQTVFRLELTISSQHLAMFLVLVCFALLAWFSWTVSAYVEGQLFPPNPWTDNERAPKAAVQTPDRTRKPRSHKQTTLAISGPTEIISIPPTVPEKPVDHPAIKQLAARDEEIKRLKAANRKLEIAGGKVIRDDAEILELKRKLHVSENSNDWLRKRNDEVLANFRCILNDNTTPVGAEQIIQTQAETIRRLESEKAIALKAKEGAKAKVQELRLALSQYSQPPTVEPSDGGPTPFEQQQCVDDPAHGLYRDEFCPKCFPPPPDDDNL